MGTEQMDYAAILADLEAKRNALDATIASFRAALALGALGQAGELPPSSNGLVPSVFGPSTYVPSVSGGEVPAGAFLGKSIPDAAKLYLEIVKKKQTSKEIADALQKGGMETTSKNFQQMVHSVLDRARKASNSGIVKLDRSHWGLATWYPASLQSAGAYQGRGASRKKGRKGKAAKAPPTSQKAMATPIVVAARPGGPTARQRTMQLLADHAPEQYSGNEVSKQLGISPQVAGMMLGQLANGGLIRKTPEGTYFAPARERIAVG